MIPSLKRSRGSISKPFGLDWRRGWRRTDVARELADLVSAKKRCNDASESGPVATLAALRHKI
jgi:hypothetical protein